MNFCVLTETYILKYKPELFFLKVKIHKTPKKPDDRLSGEQTVSRNAHSG